MPPNDQVPLPTGLTGLNAGLRNIFDRLHRATQAVRDELAPANGNYDQQNALEAELASIASDLRRYFDPAYAHRIDAMQVQRRRSGRRHHA